MRFTERPAVQRILTLSLALWVVLGVGMLAHVSSLPDPLPTDMISRATIVEPDGKVVSWFESSWKIRFRQHRIRRELDDLRVFLRSIGEMKSKIEYRLNIQNPWEFSVSPTRVELGFEIARWSGQSAHALLKAWLSQSASAEYSSQFRQDVLADVMLAISQDELRLGVSHSAKELTYEDTHTGFWEQIASLEEVCNSPWRSNSLYSICDGISRRVMSDTTAVSIASLPSPYSLRRVIGKTIWDAYFALNAFDRLDFIRGWIGFLKKDPKASDDQHLLPESGALWTWRDWARVESERLFPDLQSDVDLPGNLLQTLRLKRKEALINSGLEGGDELELELAVSFQSPQASESFKSVAYEEERDFFSNIPRALIQFHGDKFKLLPGEVAIDAESLAKMRAKVIVMETCQIPTVSELLEFPLKSERFLLVKICDETKTANYRSFIPFGIKGFALDNPEPSFVLVHRSSLEYALQKEWLKDDLLAALVEQGTQTETDQRLGVQSAEMNKQLKAFRLQGAIEAVEWLRPQSARNE